MTQHRTITIPIRQDWSEYREPALNEILSDPITQAVMRADGVEADALDLLFRDVARRMREAKRGEDDVLGPTLGLPSAASRNRTSCVLMCR
jgi:hypothetical protein